MLVTAIFRWVSSRLVTSRLVFHFGLSVGLVALFCLLVLSSSSSSSSSSVSVSLAKTMSVAPIRRWETKPVMCLDQTVQCSTSLVPSVNTIALGMFSGVKYTHHTVTPITKRH